MKFIIFNNKITYKIHQINKIMIILTLINNIITNFNLNNKINNNNNKI